MICLSISRSTEIEKGRIGGTGGREKGERRAGLGEREGEGEEEKRKGREERRGGEEGGEKLEETRRGFSLSENNLNLAKDINIHIHTVFL